MKRLALLALASTMSMGAVQNRPLEQARELYNQHRYDAAIEAAARAGRTPALIDAAALVLARAHLERYREAGEALDLSTAREALARIDPVRLMPRERTELLVGWGELLYLEGHFGAAAEQFELGFARGEEPRDARLLEWWASALDRQAQLTPPDARKAAYGRIVQRMEEELRRHAGSTVASYWLVVAARGAGDLQRAWDAAIAGWIRAPLSGEQAAALRDGLDQLVREAIIPERARRAPLRDEAKRMTAAMQAEWDTLKQAWTPKPPS